MKRSARERKEKLKWGMQVNLMQWSSLSMRKAWNNAGNFLTRVMREFMTIDSWPYMGIGTFANPEFQIQVLLSRIKSKYFFELKSFFNEPNTVMHFVMKIWVSWSKKAISQNLSLMNLFVRRALISTKCNNLANIFFLNFNNVLLCKGY